MHRLRRSCVHADAGAVGAAASFFLVSRLPVKDVHAALETNLTARSSRRRPWAARVVGQELIL